MVRKMRKRGVIKGEVGEEMGNKGGQGSGGKKSKRGSRGKCRVWK